MTFDTLCRLLVWDYCDVTQNFSSTDPRPKRWILLSKTQEQVDMDKEGEEVSTAALSVSVDGSKYVV